MGRALVIGGWVDHPDTWLVAADACAGCCPGWPSAAAATSTSTTTTERSSR